MANNTIKLKRSSVQGKVPTISDLSLGEIAINTYDGKVFIKKDDGTPAIVELGQFGYTGSIGFTGSQGDTGFTGSFGITGYTGSRGSISYYSTNIGDTSSTSFTVAHNLNATNILVQVRENSSGYLVDSHTLYAIL